VKTSATIPVIQRPEVSWGENPLLMVRKTVLSFLQGLFQQANVDDFRWHPDPEETGIVITDESPIQLDAVGKRPAISTVRGTAAWGGTSLDEMQSYDMQTDAKTHTDLVSSTISINCCSRADLESEYIAWIVANHCWMLRRVLMQGTPIHDFGRKNQIGSPSPAGAIVAGDNEGEWINTTVSIPFFLQVSASVTPQNLQLLNEIGLGLGVRGAAQVGPTGVRRMGGAGELVVDDRGLNVREPTIRGRPIRSVAFTQQLKVTEPTEES